MSSKRHCGKLMEVESWLIFQGMEMERYVEMCFLFEIYTFIWLCLCNLQGFKKVD